jgi:hypothetical protein
MVKTDGLGVPVLGKNQPQKLGDLGMIPFTN